MSTNTSLMSSAHPHARRALGLALLALLLAVGVGGFVSASSSTQYNDVQVFVQTSQNLPYSYTLTAYNSSGSQVASYQTSFPAAALELPDGTYLFTVQATYGSSLYPCIGCAAQSNTSTASPMIELGSPVNPGGPMVLANGTNPTNSTGVTPVVIPVFRVQSSNEYGYAVEQVSGPSTVTIDTVNASSIPTTQVTVHVSFDNGTAASGAWVSASIVDDNYYYYPGSSSGAQTGANGSVVLTVPQAPLIVSASLSVPITPPKGPSNVTMDVGGQEVTVQVYWQPTSVYLQGQMLILPPQTSGTVVLKYQPQAITPFPLDGVTSSGSSSGDTITSTTFTATASTTIAQGAQTRIPSFSPSDGKAASPASSGTSRTVGSDTLLLMAGVAAAAVAVTLGVVTTRGQRKPKIVSA